MIVCYGNQLNASMQLHNFIARAVLVAVVLVDEKWYPTMGMDGRRLCSPCTSGTVGETSFLFGYPELSDHMAGIHYSMCFPMFGDPLFEELFVFEPLL